LRQPSLFLGIFSHGKEARNIGENPKIGPSKIAPTTSPYKGTSENEKMKSIAPPMAVHSGRQQIGSRLSPFKNATTAEKACSRRRVRYSGTDAPQIV